MGTVAPSCCCRGRPVDIGGDFGAKHLRNVHVGRTQKHVVVVGRNPARTNLGKVAAVRAVFVKIEGYFGFKLVKNRHNHLILGALAHHHVPVQIHSRRGLAHG